MMGREVRHVPANWEHPRLANGSYEPLLKGSFTQRAAEWDEEKAKWDVGLVQDYYSERKWIDRDPKYAEMTYEEYAEERPVPNDYMPDWPSAERTHYQMYETTTEGTPISPVMASPEALARWLADNGASAFADQTATYEQWLAVANDGYAPRAWLSKMAL